MLTKSLKFIGPLLAMFIIATAPVAAQGQYASDSTGVDVSWANCSQSLPTVSFGIVGVSNGTGYTTNPCFSSEAKSYLGDISLYTNTGWYNKSSSINPSNPKHCASKDYNCLAYNYGYNAGIYAYTAALNDGIHSLTWWLDVETINTWNTNVTQNQNSLQGEYDALSTKGVLTIGVYSTTAQWQTITGNWKNDWPSWGATTWTSADQAQTYCSGHQFTAGTSYLMQFKAKHAAFDQDVAC